MVDFVVEFTPNLNMNVRQICPVISSCRC